MQKILVFGGSGLLGVNFCEKVSKKYEVYSWIHKKKIKINGIKNISGKITKKNVEAFIKKKKIDIICNFAALTSIEHCQKFKKKAFKINTNLIEKLCLAIDQNNKLLIHISTDHIFKNNQTKFDENSKFKIWNNYGKTKILAEKLIKEKLSRYIIIRTNFFGWGTGYRQSISDKILGHTKLNKSIEIWKDVFFTPIYVGYLSKLIIKLIDKKFEGVVNIGSDERVSKYQFAKEVLKSFSLINRKITPTKYSQKKFINRPKNMCLNNSKIKKIFPNEIKNFKIKKQIELMKSDIKLKKKFLKL